MASHGQATQLPARYPAGASPAMNQNRDAAAAPSTTVQSIDALLPTRDERSRQILSNGVRNIQKSRSESSKLLSIAPELRNLIYAYCLVTDRPVTIAGNRSDAMPGLLGVCKQIRREATPIYYAENIFRLQIIDFNIKPILPWLSLPKPKFILSKMRMSRDMRVSGANWANLKLWLELFHDCKAPYLRSPIGLHEPANVRAAVGAFTIIKTISLGQDVDLEPVLAGIRAILAAFDPQWLA